MSDESSLNHKSARLLREEEVVLLRTLLADHPSREQLLSDLECAEVKDMMDGGMGSVKFSATSNERRMAGCIAEADYIDSDGVPVSIAVNVDEKGRLFEIDIWKVDFGALIKYPTPKTIRNLRHFSL